MRLPRGIVLVVAYGTVVAGLLACNQGGGRPLPPIAATSDGGTTPSSTTVPPDEPPTSSDGVTDATSDGGAGSDPALGSGNAVTISFAGDISFEGEMGTRLTSNPATAIGPFRDLLTAADLAVGNLETAITTRGTAAAKAFTFRTTPKALDALRAAGFDTVSLANNHGMDFGPVGFEDTLAAKDAQPDKFVIGIGHDDADAYAPYTATIKGQRIAVIAATQVLDDELITAWTSGPTKSGMASAKREARLVEAVAAARRDADTVVVFLHWGIERDSCPSAVQQRLARLLVDAGADIVVGGHAHRLQGGGMLDQAFVGYGLGNFAFYAASEDAARTGLLTVTVTGRRIDAYQFVPGRISGRVPQPLTGAAATTALAYWESLRPCTGLQP